MMKRAIGLPWLPKNSSYPLDALQKPYYFGINIETSGPSTTALLSLAPVRSARASAATTGETSALARMMTR
jgi:hypothetical protein